MLDAGNNEKLQVATTFTRSVLEVRSWRPEHKSGEQALHLEDRELPREVGATLPGPLHVLCLAPGEWLLISDEQAATSIAARVATDLVAQGAVLVDTTDGIGTLSVSGPWSRDVLSKGCGLDFHPQVFAVGRCARTRFAQMPVIVHHTDEVPSFRLYVPRSYLGFLADWFADATVEFNASSI
jgi:heterotetrameric sarcosine oxidase gamma subunit